MTKTQNGTKIDESRLPDGGWGWMIVLGVAITNMFNQALISVFGLLFGQHLEAMGHETGGIALISNVCNMVMSFSGLLTGPILSRYSCRAVSLVGSIMTTSGLIMCSFATTLTEILLWYSCLTGLGLGLIYPASFVAIKAYFSARRGRAVGISMAGTGIGQMLMPQLVRILLDEFGFAWTVRIVAALCLHGLVGSMLYQPVKWHLKPVLDISDTKTLLNNNKEIPMESRLKVSNSEPGRSNGMKKENSSISLKSTAEKLYESEKLEYNENLNRKRSLTVEVKEEQPKSCFARVSTCLQLPLLKDASFFNLCVGVGLVHTSGVAFGMIFPFLLMEGPVLRLSRADTALCMSLLSAADIVARLTVPTITYYMALSYRNTFMWGALLLAGARTVIALQDTLSYMIAASLLCGYIRAITVINQNLTVSEYCTENSIDDKLPSALGLMMVSKGILVITLGQFLGWVRDYTRSYQIFTYGTNVLCVIVFITWMIEYLIRKFRRSTPTVTVSNA